MEILDMRQYTEPLSRTPSILRAVVEGRPDTWLDSHHEADVVSPREAVLHLAYVERESWVSRVKSIIDPEAASTVDHTADEVALKPMTLPQLLDDVRLVDRLGGRAEPDVGQIRQ